MIIVSKLLCCTPFVLERCCTLTYGQRCQDAELSLLLSLEASEEQVKALEVAQLESTQVHQLCPSQRAPPPLLQAKGELLSYFKGYKATLLLRRRVQNP